ncbi:MAG: HTH-type transcriptional repressor KstR2 [Ilumatobacteraceae bacterium]|nr:HTH-type transcriptional repressor KstR2 [Ilumatobacteraceae bacterium]
MTARTSKSERTRQRILDAAAQTFMSQGYSSARLSDIAAAAGLQTGSLYYHFDSREALVEEVLHLGIAVAWEHVRAAIDALPPEATPLDRLRAGIRAHTEVQLEISDYSSAHARIIGQVPPDVRRRNLVDQINYGEYWDGLFRDAVAVGEVRADLDLYVVRMLMFGALNWTSEWYRARAGRTLEVVVEQALALLLHGVTTASAPAASVAISLPAAKSRSRRTPRSA